VVATAMGSLSLIFFSKSGQSWAYDLRRGGIFETVSLGPGHYNLLHIQAATMKNWRVK
jgi:hypothetical protein